VWQSSRRCALLHFTVAPVDVASGARVCTLLACAQRWPAAARRSRCGVNTILSRRRPRVQANREREAVRSSQGEAVLVRQQEQQLRHAQSARRRLRHLHEIVQRATDESEKVKEVKFIKQLEAEDSKAALDERLEKGEARRAERLASRQLRNGKEVDGVLEEAQRRKRCVMQQRACMCGTKCATIRASAPF
jgi:TolA-binding protein